MKLVSLSTLLAYRANLAKARINHRAHMETSLVNAGITSNQLTQIKSHGCWGSNLEPANAGISGGANRVDDLDEQMANWFNACNCLEFEGAECNPDPFASACTSKITEIDNHYVANIQILLSNGWNPVSSGFSCPHYAPRPDITMNDKYKTCSRHVPNYISPCDNVNCGNYGTCVEGSCQCVNGYSGANCENKVCSVDSDCNSGESCSNGICVNSNLCNVDADCSSGEICYLASCLPGCRIDSDCSSGQTCSSNQCVNDPCANVNCNGNGYCSNGACICTINSECSTGHICSSGSCVPGCSVDGDCSSGQICSNSQCATGCRIDSDCTSGEVCTGNQCGPAPNCVQDSDCSGNGVCTSGNCVCNSGYTGTNCEATDNAWAAKCLAGNWDEWTVGAPGNRNNSDVIFNDHTKNDGECITRWRNWDGHGCCYLDQTADWCTVNVNGIQPGDIEYVDCTGCVDLNDAGTYQSTYGGPNTGYTDTSIICAAAHVEGVTGLIKVLGTGPQDSFESISANGITTRSWTSWPRSFKIIDSIANPCQFFVCDFLTNQCAQNTGWDQHCEDPYGNICTDYTYGDPNGIPNFNLDSMRDTNCFTGSADCTGINCGDHGRCLDGVCGCDMGYSGNECQFQESDPCYNNDCSNNGVCSNGACTCNAGFTGISCEINVNQLCNVNSDCNDPNGSCNNNVCVCNTGFIGDKCENVAACVTDADCSGNGVCNNGACVCNSGFLGTNCQATDSPYAAKCLAVDWSDYTQDDGSCIVRFRNWDGHGCCYLDQNSDWCTVSGQSIQPGDIRHIDCTGCRTDASGIYLYGGPTNGWTDSVPPCDAAYFQGLTGFITIEGITPPSSYDSEVNTNGLTTNSWGSWPRAFKIIDSIANPCQHFVCDFLGNQCVNNNGWDNHCDVYGNTCTDFTYSGQEGGHKDENCFNGALDACASVDCGQHGRCLDGSCGCDYGWTGASCEIAMTQQQIYGLA